MKLHANAALSLRQRLRMVDRVVQRGLDDLRAAAAAEDERADVLEVGGALSGRGRARVCSIAPRRPDAVANRTDERRIEAIAALRRLRFTGPEIAEVLGMPLSTVSGDPHADRDGPARPARPGARRAL